MIHPLDLVRIADVGAAVLSASGLLLSIRERAPGPVVWNAAMLALEVVYFVWVSRVRRRELARA